jgi:hypothetical protein
LECRIAQDLPFEIARINRGLSGDIRTIFTSASFLRNRTCVTYAGGGLRAESSARLPIYRTI